MNFRLHPRLLTIAHVWVVTKAMGHFSIKIAISCKNHGRPLDDTHIEKFHAEIDAYGASAGVIYTRAGFRPGAIKLASKFGIACCVLWHDRPADIPTLNVRHYYCCYDSISTPVISIGDENFPPTTWSEFFAYSAEIGGKMKTLTDHLEEAFRTGRSSVLEMHAKDPKAMIFPEDWKVDLSLTNSSKCPTEITFFGKWRKYRSRPYATLLNGSYCETSGEFHGTETSPPMSPIHPPPPKEWEEVKGNLVPEPSRVRLMLTKSSENIVKQLGEFLRNKPFIVERNKCGMEDFHQKGGNGP